MNATEALGDFDNAREIEVLIVALDDENEANRTNATEALVKITG